MNSVPSGAISHIEARGLDDMLRRALGERIEIETTVSGGLWNTFADPGQIENALLNLAINARDAMENSGKLTIEVGNAFLDDEYAANHVEVSPGQYVVLAVTDTGCGISPELIDRVLEPFFSTKPEGKGTGLGLSMVYGFVKQSEGHLKIYSEVGHGTTIKLYLPRALAPEDAEIETLSGPITGGSETVLVVEDDDEVRTTVVDTLSDLGYTVLKAHDAANALAVIESGIPIDLLFTDVVMPGKLRSPELARKARQRLPGIAVLFTSGYTENAIVHGGRLDEGVQLISKPYTRDALARKIRHVLANQQQRRAPGAHSEVSKAAVPERSLPPAAQLMVLLVEDDPLICMNTAALLRNLGHVIVEAHNAEDALVALETSAIDVLLTDIELPGMSGGALAERARTLREDIGIVFASGRNHLPDGWTHDHRTILLQKPYDQESLAKSLQRVCVRFANGMDG
jgi:CheY-like chemotaxis protein